jgi:hypothetical protein
MPEGSTAQRILECTGRNLAPEEHWKAYGVASLAVRQRQVCPRTHVELV